MRGPPPRLPSIPARRRPAWLLAVALAPFLVAGCTADVAPATGFLGGTVRLGPTCPVESDPPEPDCADRPYAADLEVRTLDDRFVVAFRSGEEGTFWVEVPVGQYRIADAGEDAAPPTCSSDVFVIRMDETTQVEVECDSGIR